MATWEDTELTSSHKHGVYSYIWIKFLLKKKNPKAWLSDNYPSSKQEEIHMEIGNNGDIKPTPRPTQ